MVENLKNYKLQINISSFKFISIKKNTLMNDTIFFRISKFAGFFFVLLILFDNISLAQIINIAQDTSPADSVKLACFVKDKSTGEPIENAIVYLGMNAFDKQKTDKEGKCVFTDNHGIVLVSAFNKGYIRYSENYNFVEKPQKEITIELEKKSEAPVSFSIDGTVEFRITNEGSKSENRYYEIVFPDGKREFIFNEVGMNIGFENFKDKKVTITGFKENGFTGWMHQETPGIYIEDIKEK